MGAYDAAHGIARLLVAAFHFAITYDGRHQTMSQVNAMRQRIERELPDMLLALVRR